MYKIFVLLIVTLFFPISIVYGDERYDSQITHYIKASIVADPAISYLNINVRTVDGIVTLTGKVDSITQKEHIENIARGVNGVMRVDSWLSVTGWNRPPGTPSLPEQHDAPTQPQQRRDTTIKVVPVPMTVSPSEPTSGSSSSNAPQGKNPPPPITESPENAPYKRGY